MSAACLVLSGKQTKTRQAFGPLGLGILAVEGVPGYSVLRKRLLLLAERLTVCFVWTLLLVEGCVALFKGRRACLPRLVLSGYRVSVSVSSNHRLSGTL